MSIKKNNKEFSIFLNALSIGWHLRKIMEAKPDLMKDKELYDKFIYWLERHEIKPIKNKKNNISAKKHENY